MRTVLPIGLAALVGASVLGAVPAAAAAAPDAEPQATYLTIYQHDDYKGYHRGFRSQDKNLNNNYWTGTNNIMDDSASSVINNRRHKVNLHQDRGFGGPKTTLSATSRDSDLSNNAVRDNSTSSIDFL